MTRIADPTFGLDRYALPMLSLLSTREPDFADFNEGAQMYDVLVQTHVFAAAGKRWVALVMFPRLVAEGLRHVVTFGRDPYHDEIVVQSWGPVLELAAGDAPTPSDIPPGVKERRCHPLDIMASVDFIRGELALAYRAMRTSLVVMEGLADD